MPTNVVNPATVRISLNSFYAASATFGKPIGVVPVELLVAGRVVLS